MKVIRIIIDVVLVLLVIILFVFGHIEKIDAENNRIISNELYQINSTLLDSIESLNQKIIQLEKSSTGN